MAFCPEEKKSINRDSRYSDNCC